MSPETLRNWIEHPELMDRHSQNDLRILMRNYPCFAGAQVLLLKLMEQENDLNFSEELFKTSLMVPNRKALYYFMKELPYPPEADNSTDQSDFGLVDQFLEDYSGDREEIKTEMPDYFQLSAYLPGQISSQSEKQTEPDLIDKFLDKPAEHIQIDKTEGNKIRKPTPPMNYRNSLFTKTRPKTTLNQGNNEKVFE
ncbi:MAG: hypothetical protein WCZ67_01040 [Bacteroidales bacterium]